MVALENNETRYPKQNAAILQIATFAADCAATEKNKKKQNKNKSKNKYENYFTTISLRHKINKRYFLVNFDIYFFINTSTILLYHSSVVLIRTQPQNSDCCWIAQVVEQYI